MPSKVTSPDSAGTENRTFQFTVFAAAKDNIGVDHITEPKANLHGGNYFWL